MVISKSDLGENSFLTTTAEVLTTHLFESTGFSKKPGSSIVKSSIITFPNLTTFVSSNTVLDNIPELPLGFNLCTVGYAPELLSLSLIIVLTGLFKNPDS